MQVSIVIQCSGDTLLLKGVFERWSKVSANKIGAEANGALEPVNKAETLVEGRTFDAVAAILLRGNAQPMVALDLMTRVGNILPGDCAVHVVQLAEHIWCHRLSWQGEH